MPQGSYAHEVAGRFVLGMNKDRRCWLSSAVQLAARFREGLFSRGVQEFRLKGSDLDNEQRCTGELARNP